MGDWCSPTPCCLSAFPFHPSIMLGKNGGWEGYSRIFASMPSTLHTSIWHAFLFPQGKGGLIHKSLLKNSQKYEPPFSPRSRNLSARSVLPRLAHHTLRSEIVPGKTTCGRFGELPFYFWLAGSLQFTGPDYHPSYTSLHCRSTSHLQ